MSSSMRPKPFKIVVGIDFSTAGESTLRRAIDLAKGHPAAEVHAVTVIESRPLVETRAELPAQPLPELTAMAQRIVDEDPGLKLAHLVAHCLVGSPAKEIVWLAARLDADVIVVGTHGRRGLERAVLGSVAEAVVRTAGCPVFVVRPKHHPEDVKIPDIEPLCDECVAVRKATGDVTAWCKRHSEHHVHAHVYSYGDYGTSSSTRPWGFTTA